MRISETDQTKMLLFWAWVTFRLETVYVVIGMIFWPIWNRSRPRTNLYLGRNTSISINSFFLTYLILTFFFSFFPACLFVFFESSHKPNIMFFYLDLCRYKTFEIPLSGRVFKGMEFLKDFFSDLLNGFLGATPQSKKDHGARNHRKFSTQQQVRLLAGASAALKSNPKFPQIAEMIGNFHLLCRSLVQVYKHKHGSRGPESVEEHPAVDAPEISEVHPTVKDPVIGLPEAKQTNQNGACADVRANVTSPDCFGMCGPHCWCWNWICGDCCLHRGCQQHDLCCNHNYLSTHCLFPWIYGFSCHEGYHGYPECLCS